MVTRAQIEAADTTGWSGVIYTCNCGFFDLGHGNPRAAAWNVGATALWNQLVIEPAYDAMVEEYRRPMGGMGEPGARAANAAFWLTHNPRARFGDGGGGFAVEYQQDMGAVIAGVRVTPANYNRRYLVRRGLSRDEKKSVALAIFMEVTMGFERLQGQWPWSLMTRSMQSSFSLEDLVSDLIGFYIAVGEISRGDALDACHACTVEQSLSIWDANPRFATLKNETFVPVLAENMGAGGDPCSGQPKAFPDVFRRIVPEPKGTKFIDMPLL